MTKNGSLGSIKAVKG